MSFLQEQRDLSACLNRLRSRPLAEVLKDEEFRKFHQIRNTFNDYGVTKLIEQPPYNIKSPVYKDQKGRIWVEETIGVKYHTNKWTDNPFKLLTDEGQTLRKWGRDKKNRYSRKFICGAKLPGYTGASYEMIIHRSGQRITSGEYMETFNFGPVGLRSSVSGKIPGTDFQFIDAGLHFKFDMATHTEFGFQDYKCVNARSTVRIIDMVDLFESGDLDLKKLFNSKFRG